MFFRGSLLSDKFSETQKNSYRIVYKGEKRNIKENSPRHILVDQSILQRDGLKKENSWSCYIR